MKLYINKIFQDLTTPLSPEEYERFEQFIVKHGCRRPIIIWGDVIIDGHKRYAICQKHDLPFTVDRMEFDSFDQAEKWARRHARFIAKCRKEIALALQVDEPVAKLMFDMPPKPETSYRNNWDISTMTPMDMKMFVHAVHKRFGQDFLKELVFVLFSHIVPNQNRDATRHLLQQLYNLHYTPTFQESKNAIP